MIEYIRELAARMLDNNYLESEIRVPGVFESGKTISSKAFEEARALSNVEFLDELYFEIRNEDNIEVKRKLYFIVKQIAINTQNIGATSFLIKMLDKEKDKDLISGILINLGELYKPAIIDISAIINCTKSKNWPVRKNSYEALTNSDFDVEEFLIQKLQNSPKIDDLPYIIGALQYVGSIKSTAIIKPFVKSRNGVVSNAATYALAIIYIREKIVLSEITDTLKLSTETLMHLKKRLPVFTRAPR